MFRANKRASAWSSFRVASTAPFGNNVRVRLEWGRRERPHTLAFRTHLPPDEHIALLIANIHGQLLVVLVNCEVQHLRFSFVLSGKKDVEPGT